MGIRINTHTPAQHTPGRGPATDKASQRPQVNQHRESTDHSLDDRMLRRMAALEVSLQNQVAAESAVSDLALATKSAKFIRSQMLQTEAKAPSAAELVPNTVLELLQ